jgi:SAM-dependent methyltransferase
MTADGKVLLVDGLPQTGLVDSIAPWEALHRGYLLEMALLLRPQPRSALVIGLGAGLAPRVLQAHGIPCESVEIDPRVVEVARREFGFDGPVTVADGRTFLEQTPRSWDLIVVDVCTDERLPYHLFTREAMEVLRRRLTPDGLVAIQFIGDPSPSLPSAALPSASLGTGGAGLGPWAARLAGTVRETFGSSVVLTAPGTTGVGPCWLMAADDPLPPVAVFAPPDDSVPWRVVEPTCTAAPMTDDHFGAEWDWARTAASWRCATGHL